MVKSVLKWTALVVCGLAIGVGYQMLSAENAAASLQFCTCGCEYAMQEMRPTPGCPSGFGLWTLASCTEIHGHCNNPCSSEDWFDGCFED